MDLVLSRGFDNEEKKYALKKTTIKPRSSKKTCHGPDVTDVGTLAGIRFRTFLPDCAWFFHSYQTSRDPDIRVVGSLLRSLLPPRTNKGVTGDAIPSKPSPMPSRKCVRVASPPPMVDTTTNQSINRLKVSLGSCFQVRGAVSAGK
jgi:hypothetical protein